MNRTHTPEDVQKIMEPWSPVSIGVDVTKQGAYVVGIYAMSDNTSQIFYAKYYPTPQRKWKNLRSSTINKIFVQTYRDEIKDGGQSFARAIEAKLKEKNT